jgi:hypothetical protein
MGTQYEQQDFADPTETRGFPNGKVDLLNIGGPWPVRSPHCPPGTMPGSSAPSRSS